MLYKFRTPFFFVNPVSFQIHKYFSYILNWPLINAEISKCPSKISVRLFLIKMLGIYRKSLPSLQLHGILKACSRRTCHTQRVCRKRENYAVAHDSREIRIRTNALRTCSSPTTSTPSHLFRPGRGSRIIGSAYTKIYPFDTTLNNLQMLRTSSIFCRKAFARSYATAGSPHALLFLEHRGGVIDSGSLSALTAAEQLGGEVSALVVGSAEHVPGVVDKAKKCVCLHYLAYIHLTYRIYMYFKVERSDFSASFDLPTIRRTCRRDDLAPLRNTPLRLVIHPCRFIHFLFCKVGSAPCLCASERADCLRYYLPRTRRHREQHHFHPPHLRW